MAGYRWVVSKSGLRPCLHVSLSADDIGGPALAGCIPVWLPWFLNTLKGVNNSEFHMDARGLEFLNESDRVIVLPVSVFFFFPY